MEVTNALERHCIIVRYVGVRSSPRNVEPRGVGGALSTMDIRVGGHVPQQ